MHASRSIRRITLALLLLSGAGILGHGVYSSHVLPNQDIGSKLCIVSASEIDEASGMARSPGSPDLIWLHNDSGDSARLFLNDRNGALKAVVSLNNVTAVDWEDMCAFAMDGANWLLIADVGDNQHQRTARKNPCRLLLIKEPKLDTAGLRKKSEVSMLNADVFATIEVQYPDGPVNCESVAVDSTRREILIVTKTDPLSCRLYSAPLELAAGEQQVTLKEIGSPGVPFATAMDISPDGRRMIIGSMFAGAVLDRSPDESWSDAATRSAKVIQVPGRKQGETVCFDGDADFILLGSEGKQQPIWRMSVTDHAKDSK